VTGILAKESSVFLGVFLIALAALMAFIALLFFYKYRMLTKHLAKKNKCVVHAAEDSADTKKLEEKNRKLFQMSEAVYREKKKVDEENELLKTEKEKLELEKKKVDEKIKKLWQQSTAIHKEKEKVEKMKEIIEQKHQDVTESITYAKRIQSAILPLFSVIQTALPESFVLYIPRDIVSGDFYWFLDKGDKTYLAAVDCTGHGVPGAFMSMVGHTLLNEIIDQKGISDPGMILNELDNSVRFVLKQDNYESSTRDGMDICLITLDKQKSTIEYAGANRPLWIVRKTKGNLILDEIKATKTAIGGIREEEVNFISHAIPVNPGDSIYLTTDGFADQFSADDKKFMTRKLKDLLLSVQDKSMQEQMKLLEEYHLEWKGNADQTDDVLVIGVRV
jgi:serine phosphatase RsbU (regulator of sigma subunit)